MRGNEVTQGYVVAGILAVVALLNLTVTTGAGAPRHPAYWYSILGLVAAAGLVVSIRFRNRLISPFVAVVGAFLVTVATAPKSLGVPHIVALGVTVAYAVILSLRHPRDQRLVSPTATAADRRAAAEARRRRRKGEPEPSVPVVKRPPANRRYTPPKATKARDNRR